jgi:phosphoserine phosphatase
MRVVMFNLNGTLTNGNVKDQLALKYGFYYDLNRLRTNYRNGLIFNEQFIKSRFKLFKGIKVDEIVRYAENLPLMPNTPDMFGLLKSRGFKLGIISDELAVVTNYFVNRFDLDYSICHEIEIKDEKLTGKVILAGDEGEYETWKKEKLKEIRNETNSKIIAVGNKDIDAPMLEEADVGIAFNATAKAKEASDLIISGKDMNRIIDAIDNLILNQLLIDK